MAEEFWENIKNEKRSVVILGTGDAGEKLFRLLKKNNVRTSAFASSDEFLRNRSFLGYKVLSLKRVKEIFGDDTVLLMGFGSHKTEIISRVVDLSREFDLYMPDLMTDREGNPTTRSLLKRDEEKYRWAYSLLEDERSREVFRKSLEYRVSGRIEPLLDINSSPEEAWDLLGGGEGEILVDGGAYDGDTISIFMSKYCSWKEIYGIEPSIRAYRKLEEKYGGRENIHLYNGALSNEVGETGFAMGHGRGNHIGEGRIVPLYTVDSILNGKEATILKYDIEGAEREGIIGARKTIEQYKPRIILSAYHRFDDFHSLLSLIWSIRSDYKVYMRKSMSLPLWDVEYILV